MTRMNELFPIFLLLLICGRVYGFHKSVTMSVACRRGMKIMAKVDTTQVDMPALSSTMTEGRIVEWLKNPGDKIEVGDVIMVVESDKADMDVEAFEEGYLAKILTQAGESASVGSAVALMVTNEADIAGVHAEGTDGAPIDAGVAVAAVPAASEAVVGRSINMPALSSTMKEGKIVAWNCGVGDKVSVGDVLLIVESDKADMDVEAFEDGYISSIITPEGDTAAVGAPVAILVDDEAHIGKATLDAAPTPAPYMSSSSLAAAVAQPAAVAPAPLSAAAKEGHVTASGLAKTIAKQKGIDLSTVAASRSDGLITSTDLAGAVQMLEPKSMWTPSPGVVPATPTARKLAKENNVDLMSIRGTGNFGRVTGDDVLITCGKKLVPTPPVSKTSSTAGAATTLAKKSGVTDALDGIVPMDGMQKAIAKNMEATLTVPIFRVSREIFTDDFDLLYAKLKPEGITVSAMLAKAVAMVLSKHPLINAAYVEGGIKYNKDVNVAMAVAIDGGLITPTIVGAQDMDLFQISATWKDLVGKAKSKKLSPAEYTSGTFTISNLGMFGVQQFDAILPPGTGSILAIAASKPKVVQMSNGYYGVKKSMIVTITCDHRHIYGVDAAGFLKDLAQLIEYESHSLTVG